MTYEQILKFHGHECPGIAMGFRMTKAALKELGVSRASDEELVAIVENDACGVDALQCLTGCTFGKGNLIFKDYGKHVYTLYSRKHNTGVRVSLHDRNIPEGLRENRNKFTEWLKSVPEEEIISITKAVLPEPEPAQIRNSIKCELCGENVMESRIRDYHGKAVCIPCLGDQ